MESETRSNPSAVSSPVRSRRIKLWHVCLLVYYVAAGTTSFVTGYKTNSEDKNRTTTVKDVVFVGVIGTLTLGVVLTLLCVTFLPPAHTILRNRAQLLEKSLPYFFPPASPQKSSPPTRLSSGSLEHTSASRFSKVFHYVLGHFDALNSNECTLATLDVCFLPIPTYIIASYLGYALVKADSAVFRVMGPGVVMNLKEATMVGVDAMRGGCLVHLAVWVGAVVLQVFLGICVECRRGCGSSATRGDDSVDIGKVQVEGAV